MTIDNITATLGKCQGIKIAGLFPNLDQANQAAAVLRVSLGRGLSRYTSDQIILSNGSFIEFFSDYESMRGKIFNFVVIKPPVGDEAFDVVRGMIMDYNLSPSDPIFASGAFFLE